MSAKTEVSPIPVHYRPGPWVAAWFATWFGARLILESSAPTWLRARELNRLSCQMSRVKNSAGRSLAIASRPRAIQTATAKLAWSIPPTETVGSALPSFGLTKTAFAAPRSEEQFACDRPSTLSGPAQGSGRREFVSSATAG